MAYRKYTNYRGGFTTPIRPPMGGKFGKMASFGRKIYDATPVSVKTYAKNFAKRNIGKVLTGIDKVPFGQIVRLGTSSYESLTRSTDSGKIKENLPLFGGMIPSPGVGTVSETFYKSTMSSRPSAALKTALSMVQRVILKFDQEFTVNTTANRQGVCDMCQIIVPTGSLTGISVAPQTNYTYGVANVMGNYGSSSTSYPGNIQVLSSMLPGASNTPTSYFHLEDVVSELTIQNTAVTAIVDIYEVVAKRDFSGGLSTYFGTSNLLAFSPVTYWNQGLLLAAAATTSPSAVSAGKMTVNTIGSLPTDSLLFNEYWDVVSKYRVTLPSNSTHIHKSTYEYHKTLPAVRFQNSSLLQGMTRNYIVVVRGVPSLAVTGSSVNIVEDFSANVSCTVNVVMRGKSLSNSQEYVLYADTSYSV